MKKDKNKMKKDKKKYFCAKCGKGFTRYGSKLRHEKDQHSDVPIGLICKECFTIIRGYNNMVVHYKRQHANNSVPEFTDLDIAELPAKEGK